MATMSRIADEILFTHIEVALAVASEATLIGLGADDPRTQRNARVDLARHLVSEDVDVVEVNRPNRQARRRRGKNDTVDAEAAARAALNGDATVIPKSSDGIVESIRVLHKIS